jgi:hypothetical protein
VRSTTSHGMKLLEMKMTMMAVQIAERWGCTDSVGFNYFQIHCQLFLLPGK